MASLASVQCLGLADVGKPGMPSAASSSGCRLCGVDVAAVPVGGHDRQRGGVRRRTPGGVADHREPEAACPCCALAQPGGQLGPTRAPPPPHVEALVDLGIRRTASVSNSRSRNTRNSRSSKSPVDVVAVPTVASRSVSGVWGERHGPLTRSVSSRFQQPRSTGWPARRVAGPCPSPCRRRRPSGLQATRTRRSIFVAVFSPKRRDTGEVVGWGRRAEPRRSGYCCGVSPYFRDDGLRG